MRILIVEDDPRIARFLEKGLISEQLQADLDRLTGAQIPVDITFRQGVAELGIE